MSTTESVGSLTQSSAPATNDERPPPRSISKRVRSRIRGFYKLDVEARRQALSEAAPLSDETLAYVAADGGLALTDADRMSENVVAVFGLPLSLGLNFVINGEERLIPMATEEPSVVAAASNAARIVRPAGGFVGEAAPPIMTAQVQLDGVADPVEAAHRIEAAAPELMALADSTIAAMVRRGGGCRRVVPRAIEGTTGLLVVHFDVDVQDAMGANTVDTVAEGVADRVAELAGGRVGLRILTNLPLRRVVRVRARAHEDDVGGAELADGIARASSFASADPYRAVTHNKGFMNGVDAAATALGQDVRSIEAGAHAYASLGPDPDAPIPGYRPLATWTRQGRMLLGEAALPMAVGTVGGSCAAHAGVRAAFDIIGLRDAGQLGVALASVGLASNLAALRALAGEGIQHGHMRLHRRKEQACTEPGRATSSVRSRS